jgi:arylsulfatase A-like enzyme
MIRFFQNIDGCKVGTGPQRGCSFRQWCCRGLTIMAGILAALLLESAASSQESPSGLDRRPNLILFLVDDLGWQDTSVPFAAEPTAFNRRYRTPHLDRLVARGMKFTQAYASAPVCTPTRTSILTGLSPGQSHITYWTLHKDQDTSKDHPSLRPPAWQRNGLSADSVCLPRLLQKSGYVTIHAGKAHFGAHGTASSDPTLLGFDVNIAGHGSGGPASFLGVHHFTVAGRRGEKPGSKPTVWDVPGLQKYHGQEIYLTEALALEACAAVAAAVAEKQPFFLNFAPYAVHAPIMANSRYVDGYPDLDDREAAYASMIETVDAALGSLLAKLEELGVIDQTILVYSSDNGGLSAHARGKAPDGATKHTHNAPLRSGKGSAYEGGTRVPTVIHLPTMVEPRTCAEPLISQDFFPTLLELAGVSIPDEHLPKVEGRSLVPLLEGAESWPDRRPLFWHQPHQWGAAGPGIEPFTSVRLGPWKLIYFHAQPRFELYDLARDLGEREDLSTRHPAKVRELAAVLDQWILDRGVQLSLDKESSRPIDLPAAAAERFLQGP